MVKNIVCFCNVMAVQLSVPVKCKQLSTVSFAVDNVQDKLKLISGNSELQILHSGSVKLIILSGDQDRMKGNILEEKEICG